MSIFETFFGETARGAAAVADTAPAPAPAVTARVRLCRGREVVSATFDPRGMRGLLRPRPRRAAVLVYDLSWSMSEHFEPSRHAVDEVVRDCAGSAGAVTVVLFGSYAMSVDAGDEDALHRLHPHFSASGGRMQSGTNFYAALTEVRAALDRLDPGCEAHIRFFTDGQHNTGPGDWPGLFEREIRPRLASRPGSTMRVWFMGPADTIDHKLRRISGERVEVMCADQLTRATKVVAGGAMARLVVETNLGAFLAVERPGCAIEIEKALPRGAPLPAALRVTRIAARTAAGLVTVLDNTGEPAPLAAAPLARVPPGAGAERPSVAFVLSLDARRRDDLEFAIERLQDFSRDDARVEDLRRALECLSGTCGSAHAPGADAAEALRRMVDTAVAMQGRAQGRELRRLRQAARKLTAGQARMREAERALPGEIREALAPLLRDSRPCERFEDAVTMEAVETLPPGEFPVLVLDTQGAEMRRVSGDGVVDLDRVPDAVSKAIVNASLSRMRARALCSSVTMRGLSRHRVTRIVGRDDFALPVLPAGHPATLPLARAVASMAVCGVPGLQLGARCCDVFPQSFFQAMARVGEAEAGDPVAPVACCSLLHYSLAYLAGTELRAAPAVAADPCDLVDRAGLRRGERVTMLRYLEAIMGDGSHDPVTLRDREMAAGGLFQSGSQGFAVVAAMLVHRRLAGGASAAALRPVLDNASDMLLSSTLGDRLKPARGAAAAGAPPADRFAARVLRAIEGDPGWVAHAGHEPGPDAIEALIAALDSGREEAESRLDAFCSLRHPEQRPGRLRLADRTLEAIRALALEALERPVAWDRPLVLPYLGDPLERVLSAIACARLLVGIEPSVWRAMKHGMPAPDLGLAERVRAALARRGGAHPLDGCDLAALALRRVFRLPRGWTRDDGIPGSALHRLRLSGSHRELERRRRGALVAALTAAVLERRRDLAGRLAGLRAAAEGWVGEQPLRDQILARAAGDPAVLADIFDHLPKTVFEGGEHLIHWFRARCPSLTDERVRAKRGRPGATAPVPGGRQFHRRTRDHLRRVMEQRGHRDPARGEVHSITSLDLLRYLHRTGDRRVAGVLFWLLKNVPSDHMAVEYSSAGWRVVELSGRRPKCWHTLFHRLRCAAIDDREPQGADKFSREAGLEKPYRGGARRLARPPAVRDPRTGREVRDFRSTLGRALAGLPPPSETAHLAPAWRGPPPRGPTAASTGPTHG